MTDSLESAKPYSHEAEDWQGLLDKESYDNKKGWTWTFYEEDEGNTPHQGWKIHISSKPKDGRQVAETVLPYLQENSISHKVTDSPYRLESYTGGNEHRLVTVFPSYDAGKKEEITVGDEDVRIQYFKSGDRDHNIRAINANTKTTARIIEDLLKELDDEEILFGPPIEGDNRKEYQVGDTRAHYRYAVNNSEAIIELNGNEPVIGDEVLQGPQNELLDVVRDNRLIGPDAEVISNHRHPQPPEVAEHPSNLNWLEEIRYNR